MFERDDLGKVIHYGNSSEVNSVRHWDFNDYLNLADSKQTMEGFDETYRDFVDYILKITHKIWEDKGIGHIYNTYHNNVTMHFGSYSVTGIKSVIAGTLETLFSFPDRKLIGQNVIWSPHEEKGYLSSHRIISTATNLNDSSFGPATGRKVTFRTAVDCAVENNRVYEEWLVRDNLWLVKQLGLDPKDIAAGMANGKISKLNDGVFATSLNENLRGQMMPAMYSRKSQVPGEIILEMLSRVWNYRLFNEVTKYYSPDAVVHYICDQDMSGSQQIQGMLVGLFASFPNAALHVDRVTYNDRDEEEGYDLAVRWVLSGLHEGRGIFGSPTGKMVQILGITHYTVIEGLITEEWLTYDGLDVYRQIAENLTEETMEDLAEEIGED